jgi:hypothetical protein
VDQGSAAAEYTLLCESLTMSGNPKRAQCTDTLTFTINRLADLSEEVSGSWPLFVGFITSSVS